MAVSEVFKKRFPQGNLFLIQGGVAQPKAKMGQLGKGYSLPDPFMDRNSFREPIQTDAVSTDARGSICKDIIAREKPDLLITEFFPLGREECRHELIPSLVQASAQGSSLWAVAGYPLLTGTNNGWQEKIVKLYQKIIIFSPAIEKDFIANSFSSKDEKHKYLEFFEDNAHKIIFAGYLLPQQEVVQDDGDVNLPKPPVPKGACRVTVLRGGGAYYPKLVAEAILASDLLGKEYYFTVVAGPSTTAKEWFFFSTLVTKKKIKNLVLLRAVGHYEELVKCSDVCVSTASYHTSVMLLKYKKKAVIVPFEGYGAMVHHEQPARASMLKEMMGAKVLPFEELTANALALAIKDKSNSKTSVFDIPNEWFEGGKVLDKQLTELFSL